MASSVNLPQFSTMLHHLDVSQVDESTWHLETLSDLNFLSSLRKS